MHREDWEEIEAKKEYLNGYRKAMNKKEMIEEHIQKLRIDTMMPSLRYSDTPSGSGGDKDLSDYMEKVEELNKKLKAEALEAAKECDKIYEAVKRVKNDDEREALERYYLMRERWDDIPKKMRISRTKFYNIYDSALKNFQII